MLHLTIKPRELEICHLDNYIAHIFIYREISIQLHSYEEGLEL